MCFQSSKQTPLRGWLYGSSTPSCTSFLECCFRVFLQSLYKRYAFVSTISWACWSVWKSSPISNVSCKHKCVTYYRNGMQKLQLYIMKTFSLRFEITSTACTTTSFILWSIFFHDFTPFRGHNQLICKPNSFVAGVAFPPVSAFSMQLTYTCSFSHFFLASLFCTPFPTVGPRTRVDVLFPTSCDYVSSTNVCVSSGGCVSSDKVCGVTMTCTDVPEGDAMGSSLFSYTPVFIPGTMLVLAK